MPKFLYTVFLATILSCIYVWNILVNTKPESTTQIVMFLITLGLAVGLVLSIIIYFLLLNRSPNFTNLKYLYRKSLKIGLVISSGVTLYLGLRAASLDNILNTILLVGIYIVILSNLFRRR